MPKSIRRVHDAQFKTKVVLEALKGTKTRAQLSSEFGIHAQQITERSGVPVEKAGSRRHTNPIRVRYSQTNSPDRATRTNRSPSFSADWSTKSRERLAQKKITNELVSDRRYLIEPACAYLSISQQCDLLAIPRSTY